MNTIDKALMSTEIDVAEESTSSEAEEYFKLITSDITYLRAELQSAKIDNNTKRIKHICEYGLKVCSEFYRHIEAIPETWYGNYADLIFMYLRNIAQIASSVSALINFIRTGQKDPVSLTLLGINTLTGIRGAHNDATFMTKYKDARKINDSRFGNRFRVGRGNNQKEMALRIVSDLIVLLQQEQEALKAR